MSTVVRLDRRERPAWDIALGSTNGNPQGIGLWALIREDFATHDREFFSQGFWALAVHRFGNWRMGVRPRLLRLPFSLLYKFLEKWIEWTCGITLGYTVKVGRRVRIWHHGGMVFSAISIGNDVHLRQNTTFGVKRRGDPRWLRPVIEDGCDIGAGAVIVGGVTVGRGSVVGANVVLSTSVPANTVVTAPRPSIVPPDAEACGRRAP